MYGLFSNLYDIGAELTGVCPICFENGVIHHINLPYNEEFICFWEEDDENYILSHGRVCRTKKNETKLKQNTCFPIP